MKQHRPTHPLPGWAMMLAAGGLFCLIITAYGLLQPKARGWLFARDRAARWEAFQTSQSSTLDLNVFFETRELMGGFGAWYLDDDTIEIGSLFMNLPAGYLQQPTLLLGNFRSPHLTSQTYLVKPTPTNSFTFQTATQGLTVDKKGDDYVFGRTADGQKQLVFTKSGSEYFATQGLFKLSPPEQSDVEHRVWIEVVKVIN